jgi:hypothetical protein
MVLERAQAEDVPAAEIGFTRRDIRAATGWSDNQLKVHCVRLAELEYLLVQGGCRGQVVRYTLAWDGGGEDGERHLCGLIDPATLPDAAVRPEPVGPKRRVVGPELGSSWPQVGGVLDPIQVPKPHADHELVGDGGLNGTKPHIKAPSPGIAVVV